LNSDASVGIEDALNAGFFTNSPGSTSEVSRSMQSMTLVMLQ
jgi:hypothetical protein